MVRRADELRARLVGRLLGLGLVVIQVSATSPCEAAPRPQSTAVPSVFLGRWKPMSSNATSLTGSIRIDAKAIASQKAGRLVFAPAQPFSAEGMVRVKATSRNSLCGGKPVTFVQVGPSSEGPDTMMLRVLSGDHPVVSDTSLDVCAEFGYAR